MYERVLFAPQVSTSERLGPAVLQRTRRCVKDRAIHVHVLAGWSHEPRPLFSLIFQVYGDGTTTNTRHTSYDTISITSTHYYIVPGTTSATHGISFKALYFRCTWYIPSYVQRKPNKHSNGSIPASSMLSLPWGPDVYKRPFGVQFQSLTSCGHISNLYLRQFL